MSKNILIKTNLIVCLIIIVGFVVTSIISYSSNNSIYRKDMECVSYLTSEGIYYQMESVFKKPVTISLTMANDSLLKEYLSEEEEQINEAYIEKLQIYLDTYREKYAYDSVFLVSAKTNRYYNFNGVNRILQKGDPENNWYFAMLSDSSTEECSLNVDNDEASDNEITVFINCKIVDDNGAVIGIVGVGFRIDYLQSFLQEYEEKFGVEAILINAQGKIEVSTDKTGYQNFNLFDVCGYEELREEILNISNKDKVQTFWHIEQTGSNYIVVRYIPELSWYLVIENNTGNMEQQLWLQFYKRMFVIVAVTIFVLLVITYVIRGYNKQIIKLAISSEQEKQSAFREATEQLYDDIYEINITNNCAIGKKTEEYFARFGASGRTFEEALALIARGQIKEEYQEGYMNNFSRENILRQYANGHTNLQYDFMMAPDGAEYYWYRIIAYIYYWKEEDSIRMFAYHKNIDLEKRRELKLTKQAETDEMTKIYNKSATQKHIERMLEDSKRTYAFFIFDIDNFKQVNDTWGHVFGDKLIIEFASIIKRHLRGGDVIGRIGGDEFAAFIPIMSRERASVKAAELSQALQTEYSEEVLAYNPSASIGVAIAPEDGSEFEELYRNADLALYQAKKRGKNGYTVFDSKTM